MKLMFILPFPTHCKVTRNLGREVVVVLSIDAILPMKSLRADVKLSAKYRQIVTSIRAVGMVEPPVVQGLLELRKMEVGRQPVGHPAEGAANRQVRLRLRRSTAPLAQDRSAFDAHWPARTERAMSSLIRSCTGIDISRRLP